MTAALLLALAACIPAPATTPCLVYGLTLVPSGIDPHVNASSELGIPLTSVYDTLVYQDPATGEFVPGLAESWQIAPDGKVYTFTLRTDVKFHDGTPFDAEAAAATFQRITDPNLRSQKAVFLLGPLDRAAAADKRTLVLTLKSPYAPLLDGLSQVYTGIASPTAVKKWGAEYQNHQVGTGPYMFSSEGYQPGIGLTLVRNPDYRWGPRVFQHQGPAHVEQICFRFYQDPATRALKLTDAEAQVVGEIPPAAGQAVDDSGKASIAAVPIPGLSLQVFINTQRPPTDELAVRRAMLLAANRGAIIEKVFANRSPLAEGPLGPTTFGYDPTIEGKYAYQPSMAEALLDEAGWRDTNGDGVREKNGQPLELDFVIQSWGFMPQVAELLEADWKAVGIGVKPPRVVTFPQAIQIGKEGSYHVMPYSSSGSDPDLLTTVFGSQGAFNWSKVSSPDLDAWLTAAAQSSDAVARQELYAKVQQAVMDQALIIPIRGYVNLNGVSRQVIGLRFDRRGWFPWLVDVELK